MVFAVAWWQGIGTSAFMVCVTMFVTIALRSPIERTWYKLRTGLSPPKVDRRYVYTCGYQAPLKNSCPSYFITNDKGYTEMGQSKRHKCPLCNEKLFRIGKISGTVFNLHIENIEATAVEKLVEGKQKEEEEKAKRIAEEHTVSLLTF